MVVSVPFHNWLHDFVTQDVVLPKEHCDDRVEIMQADARTLDVHELYAKYEVMLHKA